MEDINKFVYDPAPINADDWWNGRMSLLKSDLANLRKNARKDIIMNFKGISNNADDLRDMLLDERPGAYLKAPFISIVEDYDYAHEWWEKNMLLLDKIVLKIVPSLSPFYRKGRWLDRKSRRFAKKMMKRFEENAPKEPLTDTSVIGWYRGDPITLGELREKIRRSENAT